MTPATPPPLTEQLPLFAPPRPPRTLHLGGYTGPDGKPDAEAYSRNMALMRQWQFEFEMGWWRDLFGRLCRARPPHPGPCGSDYNLAYFPIQPGSILWPSLSRIVCRNLPEGTPPPGPKTVFAIALDLLQGTLERVTWPASSTEAASTAAAAVVQLDNLGSIEQALRCASRLPPLDSKPA